MRLRPVGFWLLLAAAALSSTGCFCGPWGHWHRCGYASPEIGVAPLPNETIVVAPAVPVQTVPVPVGR
jgi:hypothetical protein